MIVPKIDSDEPRALARCGFEFEFNGKTVSWAGHGNVYAWHRYLGMHADTVECALMALEKWLYDEVENQRSISQWVKYIFEHATSAAFAGVLVSVGLRYQVLFAMDLQPLLGNFYLYQTQMSLANNESGESWTISFAGQPQEAVKIAAEWNRMPHRRYLLRDLAPALMLQHKGTMEYLTAKKAEWAKLGQGSEKSRLDMEFFLARFDPANYTRTPHGEQENPAVVQAIMRHAKMDMTLYYSHSRRKAKRAAQEKVLQHLLPAKGMRVPMREPLTIR